MMNQTVKIDIQDVNKYFYNDKKEAKLALDTVNFQIKEKELICLLGPSGCGKSTLLNIMAGFFPSSQGKVTINGLEVKGPNPKYLTIFQHYGLFPWRTVKDNVTYGLEIQGVSKAEQNKTAEELLELVGLSDWAKSFPKELSGGMQQRVALARALAVSPEVLFMDEPFGALDTFTRQEMQEQLVRIWKQKGKTIIFVTHDLDEALYLADRIVIMTANPGRISKVIEVELPRPRDRKDPLYQERLSHVYQAFANN